MLRLWFNHAINLGLLAFVLAACSMTSPPPGTVTSILVTGGDTLMLTPGDDVHLEWTFTGTGLIPSEVTITSSETDVVLADETGLLQALAQGTSTVTISSFRNDRVAATVRCT
jgi:Bacterial Ig-like domain (group 2).